MSENIVASFDVPSYAWDLIKSGKGPKQVFEEMVKNKTITVQELATFCAYIYWFDDEDGLEIAYVGYWENKICTVLTRVPNTNQLTLVGMEQLDHIPSSEEIDEIFKRHTAPQGEVG